jgi:8-oxo-dGTP pyrophosphatase MutT (NUDIX family)
VNTIRPGSPEGPLWDPTAIPAATVIVLRQGGAGLEVLMLRRDRDLVFAGGAWVFPGGRIDAVDVATGGDQEGAARVAAVREAAEEAGLVLDPRDLLRWSHWTPPPESPRRRYSTAFFVASLPRDGEVRVDDREIREHRWQRPSDVMAARDAGEVLLTPPTFITLCELARYNDVASVMADTAEAGGERAVEHFATRVAITGTDPDEIVVLYHGDSGYETGDAATPGRRHRLHMGNTWRYEREQ